MGLALRGNACSFKRASKRSSSDLEVSSMIAFSSARLAAYFATTLVRFFSRSINDNLATITS